jgi:hypothetical protein
LDEVVPLADGELAELIQRDLVEGILLLDVPDGSGLFDDGFPGDLQNDISTTGMQTGVQT